MLKVKPLPRLDLDLRQNDAYGKDRKGNLFGIVLHKKLFKLELQHNRLMIRPSKLHVDASHTKHLDIRRSQIIIDQRSIR
jgi:hypothetical protein